MAHEQTYHGVETFNKVTGNLPSSHRRVLEHKLDTADKKKHSEKLPDLPPAQNHDQFYETDPETKQFLRDIALLFSRERSGSNASILEADSIGQGGNGPKYVSAAIVSARHTNKGEDLLTIHVALNKPFDFHDDGFADKLAKFLNRPRCNKGDHRDGDIWKLAEDATEHCAGRFKSYMADAEARLRDCNREIFRLNGVRNHDRVEFQLWVEQMTRTYSARCNEKELIALKKLSIILRSCRRIVHFRDTREGMLCGRFEIRPASATRAQDNRIVHCEVKLVHEYLSDHVRPHVFDFIGCSKLQCLRCWHNVNKGTDFRTDDTHWKLYRWNSPIPWRRNLSVLTNADSELDDYLDEVKPSEPGGVLCPESPVDEWLSRRVPMK